MREREQKWKCWIDNFTLCFRAITVHFSTDTGHFTFYSAIYKSTKLLLSSPILVLYKQRTNNPSQNFCLLFFFNFHFFLIALPTDNSMRILNATATSWTILLFKRYVEALTPWYLTIEPKLQIGLLRCNYLSCSHTGWSRKGPHPIWPASLQKDASETRDTQEVWHITMTAHRGTVWLPVRECQTVPANHQRLENGEKEPPIVFRKSTALLIPWGLHLSLQNSQIAYFYCFNLCIVCRIYVCVHGYVQLVVCVHIQGPEKDVDRSAPSPCLTPLRQGLSQNPKLLILARLAGQQARRSCLSHVWPLPDFEVGTGDSNVGP